MSDSPVPLEPNRRRREFLPELESLRGAAALLVAAFHSSQSPWAEGQKLLSHAPDWHLPINRAFVQLCGALFNGHGAVVFFFVLSGFVLSGSFERGPQRIGAAARRFFVGRVFRIYPAVIATIIIFASVFWISGLGIPDVPGSEYTPVQLLRNMLLLEASVDGVMWSLQVELLAAPIIFAAAIAARRWGVTGTLALAVVLVGVGFHGGASRALGPGAPSLGLLYTFVLGMLVFQLRAHTAHWMRLVPPSLLLTGMLALFFGARPVIGGANWGPFFEAVAAAVFIAIVTCRHSKKWQCLRWPPLRFYGRISYSLYLLHPLTLIVAWRMQATLATLLQAGVPTALVVIAVFIISTAIITPLAWLSWRLIELPGNAIGNRVRD
jgi:peptidoglycan/LPS O-acetylase OafA/YrhL